MVYRAIGLMSESGLKGLDITYVEFQNQGGQWDFEVLKADFYSYSEEWIVKLQKCANLTASDYQLLHSEYGHYLGQQINKFIEQNHLHYKTAVIGSYGHAAFSLPGKNITTVQLGNGAAIAAITGLPVVCDFFAVDAALGGAGISWHLLQKKIILGEGKNEIKKAVLSAFMAVLRWREEYNVFAPESGASRNSIGGALWLGQEA